MKIKEYIERIIENGKHEDMEKLSNMFDEVIIKMKIYDEGCYEEYKDKLYEMAYGKTITSEMAYDWVNKMKPKGEYWTYEETTQAMQNMGYSVDRVSFYIVANMMINDYYDLVKDNEELALKMAYDWLNDKDSKDNKLYRYLKHIAKRD